MITHEATAGRSKLWLFLCVLASGAAVAAGGCGADKSSSHAAASGGSGGQGSVPVGEAGVDSSAAGNAAAGEAGATDVESVCPPARSSYSIPARAALYQASAGSSKRVMLVSELVSRVDGFCAGCHRAPAAQGNFSYTTDSFAAVIPADAPDLVLSSDDMKRMPPSSPYPIREDLQELASLLKLWLDQGRPTVTIKLPETSAGNTSSNPYAPTAKTGPRITNLGDCIPSPKIIGADLDDTDAAREKLFANIKTFEDLPKKLSQTDLFTFDTETLARHRTVAFAPTYALWSFDVSKIRYLHLPKGTSLKYDAASNNFIAPPNARVYKTFAEPVTDVNGKVGYRKLETRLIIARPDVDAKDGSQTNAIFGTYVWNDDESEATLLEKPYIGTDLNDPNLNTYTFKDLIKPFVADERVFQETLEVADNHNGSIISRPLQGTKEYPIPGWHRCQQCHEGSPSKNFFLGVTPLEFNRRPLGQGGVYEEAGPDELTQAQRFIDYGFITGIKRVEDFVKLEDTAGVRKPRNDYELRAQAYAVGNCSGCHNPRGYPTRLNPSLAFYNLLPGGILFQFPLDTRSPLRFHDPDDGSGVTNDVNGSNGWQYINPTLSQRPLDAAAQKALSGTVPDSQRTEVGPWNSLIFRNVQTPRTYGEGNIIFPHMPLHVGGIDCRARTILGSWMASIPFTLGSVSGNDGKPVTIPVDSATAEARAAAEARVQTFLTQEPACEPAQDLRDWGAEAPNFTDLVPPMGIPDRPHWFEEDFTEVFGDFQPRGGQWHSAMLLDKYAYIRNFEPSAELQEFVQKEVPFDFWQDKPGCDFSNAPAPPDPAPYWMDKGNRPDGDPKRVYSTLPGAAVFGAICSNCHGPRANAESNLASTIANLTGGSTRVANWAQGFFGPPSSPDSNLSYFTTQKLDDKTSLGEYGAAKYMLFMALGGTQALIPPAAMVQVAHAKVASRPRNGNAEVFASTPNMLEIAKQLCATTIEYDIGLGSSFDQLAVDIQSGMPNQLSQPGQALSVNSGDFVTVTTNGEYLLYRQLCAIKNPRPVRVLNFDSKSTLPKTQGWVTRAAYAAANLDLNSETDPWCVHPDSPYVPPGAARCPPLPGDTSQVADDYVNKGVLNVGFAVYAYAKAAFADPTQWRPNYDQCELRFPRH